MNVRLSCAFQLQITTSYLLKVARVNFIILSFSLFYNVIYLCKKVKKRENIQFNICKCLLDSRKSSTSASRTASAFTVLFSEEEEEGDSCPTTLPFDRPTLRTSLSFSLNLPFRKPNRRKNEWKKRRLTCDCHSHWLRPCSFIQKPSFIQEKNQRPSQLHIHIQTHIHTHAHIHTHTHTYTFTVLTVHTWRNSFVPPQLPPEQGQT